MSFHEGTELSAQARAEAGAELMDSQDPGWWREDATPCIDLETLDLDDGARCVWGQRYGGFASGLFRYDLSVQETLVTGLLAFSMRDAAELTGAWTQLMAARRGVRPPSDGDTRVFFSRRFPFIKVIRSRW